MQFTVKTKDDLKNLIADLNNQDYVSSLEGELDHQALVNLFNEEERTGPDAVGVAKLNI
ncbi:hypothetical protein [uncultured Acetobacteroides sp.]|uniref:hypothetical protein n=1 Tax=uncultured Acetobacteroides sp. TaxID=1760811 RepID=UPI0029F5C10B|nr:hypothetical protein [uncultured Acetobacteroides sp.]